MIGDDLTPMAQQSAAGAAAAEQLLATKLRAPPLRTQLLARPALTRSLEEARPGVLTLVCAPAGFGKTALVTAWCRGHEPPAAYLSLDAEDDDPVRFWTYLLLAVDCCLPGVAAVPLEILRRPNPPPAQAVLTPLVNALSARAEPLTLVLDDFHVIHETAIHEALAWLLEQLPESAHVVIASRTEPPLPLSRLRARGQLFELRAPELRFTDTEADAFLNELMGLRLGPVETRQLVERTEGWIAGLQLAALSLRGHDDPASFVNELTGSQRHVFDYLIEEVLEHQPSNVARFLLDTCILRRLCGALCDAVTERSDGQATLEAIEAANLFLFPLDGERRWYRYHQLFAEALRARAQQHDPEDVRARHRRASRWLEAHDFLDDAARHALDAGDSERAARLVAARAPALIRHGEGVTLLRWLSALPEEAVAADPRLCVHFAWGLFFQGHIVESDAWLARAHAHAPQEQLVRGEIAAMSAFLSVLRLEQDVSFRLAREALELLPDEHPLLDMVAMTLAMEHVYAGRPAEAGASFERAARLARRRGNRFALVCSIGQVGDALAQQGRLHLAAQSYQEAERAGRLPGGESLPIVGLASVGLGEVLREWNRLDEAEEILTRGIALCRQSGELATYDGLFSLARVQHAKSAFDAAFDTLDEVGELIARLEARDLEHLVGLHRARFHLLQGRLEATLPWRGEAQRVADSLLVPVAELVHLTLARIELARRDPGAALRRLERLREPAVEARRLTGLLQILSLQAVAQAERGRERRAFACLGSALALAEPDGFVRIFADEGTPLLQLLLRLRAASEAEPGAFEGWTLPYLETLLTAFPADDLPAPATPDGPEALTDREREVLRAVALGASNKQIAKSLGIAPSTVKWYVSQVFAKLAVRSRTQAVARAREHGLL